MVFLLFYGVDQEELVENVEDAFEDMGACGLGGVASTNDENNLFLFIFGLLL